MLVLYSEMILKRYGAMLHSVEPHFDARALNEIGFQRSHEMSVAAAEFTDGYELIELHELVATADALVQMEAEQAVLKQLSEQLEHLQRKHHERVLVLENEVGRDYPKLHEKMTTIVVEGENRLHFHRTVDPPLRMGVYAPRPH